MNDSADELLKLLQGGSDDAAEAIFHRYVGRLIAVSRKRLSAKMKRRIDEEDVVQSAFRSFFHRAKQGQYELEEGGDLWRLLVVITLNKLRRKVDYHSAAKRGITRETAVDGDGEDRPRFEATDGGPSPEAELELSEELNLLTAGFSDVQRRMVELRLQGYQMQEIADDAGTSERTIRRTMENLRQRMSTRVQEIETV